MALKTKPATDELAAVIAAQPEASAEAAAPAAPEAAPAAPVQKIGLEDFCRVFSAGKKSAIAIAITPFFNEESKAGRLNDTEAAYKARFDAFLNRPER